MSIAADAIGQVPLAADPPTAASTSKTPPKRTSAAVADPVQQPEAR